ncbi:MAG: DUF1294 domain-containing protein [Candidatus Lokiarchaeota archaeon]|nr:DUF1294 domain-containing protein [Candidatus Lokiarchaeota archaeon]
MVLQTEYHLFNLLPLIYIILIQFIAVILVWWDKRKAQNHEWRVAEATLLLSGFLGGAIGLLFGIFRFRHKTKKRGFQLIALVSLFLSLIFYWLILNFYLPM